MLSFSQLPGFSIRHLIGLEPTSRQMVSGGGELFVIRTVIKTAHHRRKIASTGIILFVAAVRDGVLPVGLIRLWHAHNSFYDVQGLWNEIFQRGKDVPQRKVTNIDWFLRLPHSPSADYTNHHSTLFLSLCGDHSE